MNASRTARERVRAEMIKEITDVARKHLATEGAAGLSLRAIARELGMVSSAIYRYFAGRDELLTALIIEGYNAIGEVVEEAGARARQDDYAGRWLAVCRAVRQWALANPHEYALLYGSPVPGYKAPPDTVTPALRDTVVYGRILTDAYENDALTPPDLGLSAPTELSGDMERVRELMPRLPDDLVARAVLAWAALFGIVSFEVFGRFDNTIYERDALFDHNVRSLARLLGLP
ncbi:MAG TPA: TetR/AcrR family transcriptional regulator [Jiangellaceae bacterium]